MTSVASGAPMQDSDFAPHTSHWGVFSARWRNGELEVKAHPDDPDPNEIIQNFPTALRHRARVTRPMVRRGWLENGPGHDERRGRDEFVPLSWDEANEMLGKELKRVRDDHGPGSVFGGSYGWASAGRFHHAQSQIHRFLNVAMGGYVKSVNSYSAGASSVILPHVLGDYVDHTMRNVTWDQIVDHSEIVLAFGGMALKNSMVAGGSISRHVERGSMERARARGCEFIVVGPIKADLPEEAGAEWINSCPGTDTALMLALAHTLVTEGLHDRDFLARYTVGWEQFRPYLLGKTDGQPKDARWASSLTGVSAEAIVALAHRLHGRRSLIVVSHSLQRARFGEQPVWMGAVLAALLGQMGLPGGGYSYALGGIGYYGRRNVDVPLPTLSQGQNACSDYIPVARIADMLLNPKGTYRYNGESRTYPDIKLVYWAGGNPFHHHQDLNRLASAFRRVDTVVVHELAWTATARHADFVLPCTITLEREDIGGSSQDPLLVPMHPAAEPIGEARDDYDIFSDLAEKLGSKDAFTEGRSSREWLEHLYEKTRIAIEDRGTAAPDFGTFWAGAGIQLPMAPDDGGLMRAFRNDPDGAPLRTPSGRIEIFSTRIDSFKEADFPGHPVWRGPAAVPQADAPLILVANQPSTRLHSQLDFGAHSDRAKHRGREVALMHSSDADERGIREGDIVRLHNARGSCLAGVRISDNIRQGVIQLPTGAWYDPEDPEKDGSMCVHGNPNVLTEDIGTSGLAQGCTGQLTTVEVEKFLGDLPPIKAFDPG